VKLTEFKSSIAVRLAMLFAVVAVVGFSLIALALNVVMKTELERHQFEQIQSRTEDMRYMLMHAHPPGIAKRAKEKIEALSPSDGRARYWLWSEAPEFRYGDGLHQVLDVTDEQPAMVNLELDGRSFRVIRQELAATDSRPAVTLVVGVDTSIVHLAGAMGKQVCMLDRYDNCWRWLHGRSDTPWYPSMTIFRQDRPNDWTGPMDRMVLALKGRFSAAVRPFLDSSTARPPVCAPTDNRDWVFP